MGSVNRKPIDEVGIGNSAGGKKGHLRSLKRPLICERCKKKSKRTSAGQKRCPPCAKIRHSEAHRARYTLGRGGDHNGRWAGGSASWQIRQFRGTECERCGSDGKMHLHHRDRDRSNWKDGNLETLCIPCHREEHKNDKGEEYAA